MKQERIEQIKRNRNYHDPYNQSAADSDCCELIDEIERLQGMIDKFWNAVKMSYDIEPREFFEEQAPKTGNWTPMEMALHHIWKRDPKNEQMREVIKKCAEKFREYEKIHMAKLPKDDEAVPAIFPSPFADIEEKVKRNLEMAEMCEAALK